MRNGLVRAGGSGVAMAVVVAILLLLTPLDGARQQAPPEAQDSGAESYRISVDVALVVLHATVTGRQGGFVSDLDEQDFEVYEDGVRQHIRLFDNEDVPVTVGLVIDHSSTMRPKLAEVTAAARAFVRSSNLGDEMFVVNFNEHVSLGLPCAVRFTADSAQLEHAISSGLPGGQTALYDAIATGLQQLQTGSRDKKVLIVVSDGGDNASAHSLVQVMKMAGQSSALIYTIGLFDADDPDQNPGVLRRLARATGGEVFLPERIGDVVAISTRIAQDIRHQYTLGYVPTKLARDGTHRTIRVVARTKGLDKLSVRTRTGYIAAGESKPGEKAPQ